MKRTFLIIGYLVFAMVALTGCENARQSTEPAISEAMESAIASFNRGAGLLEQYQFATAAKAFEKVLETAPDWTAARYNLGLAYLNMQEQAGAKDYLELSREAFEAVLASKPNHLHAQFCLGLYYQHLGNNEKAVEYFRSVYRADDKDPYVLYKLAEALISLGQTEEGTELLEKTIELDPGFVSAVYRLASQYQRTKRREKARPLFERFKELKDAELTGGVFTVLKTYGSAGKYYMALGADNLPIPTEKAPLAKRILFIPKARLNAKVSAWQWSGGNVGLAGIAAGDIDGDGDLDLCITGFGSDGKVQLWKNNGSGEFLRSGSLGQKGISPCFGDVDDDGDIDLWLGRAGADIFFENDGKGNFKKRQADGLSGSEHATQCARLIDIDNDGDLDFLSFGVNKGSIPAGRERKPAPGSVYNNNRDGSFSDIAKKLGLVFENTPISAMVYDDFDNDRDLDLIVFSEAGEETLSWVNDRVWEYHILDAGSTGLSMSGIVSAVSGDPDKDGDRDLLVFTGRGPGLIVNEGGFRFRYDKDFGARFGRVGGTGGQFADMDNDGDLDILIADGFRKDGTRGPILLLNDQERGHFVNALDIDPGNLLSAIAFEGDGSCVAADFTGNGKCDVFLAPTGEKPFLLENVTPGGHWIEIDLLGTREQDKKSRSNNSAIGARVEIKAGNISQQYVVGTASGPVAMAPYRIHAGLGKYVNVDWLRIIWPDGVLQAELELAADQLITITELQRKTSSCPHLFAWDGTHFEFISDFAGMGGVGYFLGEPGQYAKPDPTEYLPIPNLKARNGEYILQVLEPLEEVIFFDEAKLIAVDHPVGTEVYPNEMMAINITPPEFELFCYEDTIEPVGVVDHRGVDVTDEVRTIDRKYAGTTELDNRFTGFAKEHFLEVDFGDGLGKVSPGSQLVLFLYGWVEYGYSTTNFAANQAGIIMRAPSIEVFRNGKWVELFGEVGYPAGIKHMMTLDVTGKILPGDRRIRISTNMEIYWDRIFMASVLEDSLLSVSQAPVKNGDLHFLGFPREFTPDGHHPVLYDYDNIDRTVPWKTPAGNYTRFGDVTELLEEADDCFVVMGRGDELTLRFSAESFGPIPQGRVRTFILKTDSFCKDMDFCSGYPDTVGPMPFHDMSNYPYGTDEHYPDDQKRRDYQRRFNTRKMGEF